MVVAHSVPSDKQTTRPNWWWFFLCFAGEWSEAFVRVKWIQLLSETIRVNFLGNNRANQALLISFISTRMKWSLIGRHCSIPFRIHGVFQRSNETPRGRDCRNKKIWTLHKTRRCATFLSRNCYNLLFSYYYLIHSTFWGGELSAHDSRLRQTRKFNFKLICRNYRLTHTHLSSSIRNIASAYIHKIMMFIASRFQLSAHEMKLSKRSTYGGSESVVRIFDMHVFGLHGDYDVRGSCFGRVHF